MKFGKRLFDVIMMDPPWKLSTSNPSRGVMITYPSLHDEVIEKIPVEKLQNDGFIFVWAINNRMVVAAKMMKKWGYKIVDSITWVKSTVRNNLAKGHGYYLQHAKEICLVGVKGKPNHNKSAGNDLIFSPRRGQSQKP